MDWLKNKILVDIEDAKKDEARARGRQEAYKQMMVYLDTQEHCQICGESFWRMPRQDEIDKHNLKHEVK